MMDCKRKDKATARWNAWADKARLKTHAECRGEKYSKIEGGDGRLMDWQKEKNELGERIEK